ncbi:MAG TPA: malto-oligosyltrehalose synthase [Caulobacteraceae bacterium]|jgi:(1->4)-alpha-D-glucan 1-alpha-D-glucosylmutase|nr:malto-oligosyltrehalose synthase [Caulobacteraceae bacterium]
MSRRSAIPSATYRLQLHKGFTFRDAQARLGYFSALGISHLYLSPILAARSGSLHGYDVVDHSRISEELGGEAGFQALAETVQAAGLGVILDIVPNHMAVGSENLAWLDVVEKGRSSNYARLFDIDFESPHPELSGKVLAPILGEPYGVVLANGELRLIWDDALHKLVVAYGPHRLPIRPEDAEAILGGDDPPTADLSGWRSANALHALLERQNFRLAWWRSAGDEINWRRFFDVNELIGLRVEDEAVFEMVHQVPFRLYAEGRIDGLRLDHVDGLADPTAYLHRLKARLQELNSQRPAAAPADGPYHVVEKILGAGEALRPDWPVDGTTGYDFMDQVSALQHAPEGQAELDALWTELSGRSAAFESEETSARVQILAAAFAGQRSTCARVLAALAANELATRDLGAEGFHRALSVWIRHLRVYRGYATGAAAPLEPPVDQAFQAAAKDQPGDKPWLDFIVAVMSGQTGASETVRGDIVRRLNQLAAPVAAKAVEDTAFYRYGRLLSRTDVGFEAGRFALAPSGFLETGQARSRLWPRAMLTTATHDHKRGEDVRARLAVLSELPLEWRSAVERWLVLTAPHRPVAIALDDVYTLFQTLLGAWPLDLACDDVAGLREFGERLALWREKSLREAKLRSSWAAPDTAYEETNRDWLEALLDPTRSIEFLQSLHAFVTRIAPAGIINSLVQTALRCTWPGVPDLYQGAELWDFSLVDPDNRRAVDYDRRDELQRSSRRDWTSGAAKQALIGELLTLRRAAPELFTHGSLEPCRTRGPRADHVLAFERRWSDQRLAVAVMMRVAAPVAGQAIGQTPSQTWWADTEIEQDHAWRPAAEVFGGEPVFYDLAGDTQ